MQLNDATRIIDIIDQRIRKATASESRVETTWGTVAAVSPYGRYVDLYLYGQSAPYTSDYFRLPNGLAVDVGDSVKAAIDRERGDRWVEEVHSFAEYNKVEFDIVDGELRFGDGTEAPFIKLNMVDANNVGFEGGGVYFRRSADTSLAILTGEEGQITNMPFAIRASGQHEWGDGIVGRDTNLYRGAASVLKTDDVLHAVGGLRVTSPGSQDGQNFEGVRIVLPNNGYTGLAIYSNPGDTQPSFRWAGWGGMEFGPAGSTAPDTTIARVAAGVIKIDTSGSADQGLRIGDDSEFFDVDLADRIGIKGQQNSANGGIVFGSGKDVELYRLSANILATGEGDSLYVGGPLTTTGKEGVILNAGGSIEVINEASTPFIDFKDEATDDYDARIIFNLDGTGRLQFEGADVKFTPNVFLTQQIGSYGVTTNTTFAINNGGTATFSSKSLTWSRIGPWVFMRLSFAVTANGSGATTVTVTGTGLPQSSGTPRIVGDRGGTGVNPVVGRGTNASGEMTLSIGSLGTAGFSNVTGADLANGASYSFIGCYYTADAF
jgi:hypothetical protein